MAETSSFWHSMYCCMNASLNCIVVIQLKNQNTSLTVDQPFRPLRSSGQGTAPRLPECILNMEKQCLVTEHHRAGTNSPRILDLN